VPTAWCRSTATRCRKRQVIVNATARYNWPLADGNLFVLTDWSYRSKINFFLYESKEFTGKSMVEGGLRVGYNWAGGKYEVAFAATSPTPSASSAASTSTT
jgi:iron complex outermembrane receptor protein